MSEDDEQPIEAESLLYNRKEEPPRRVLLQSAMQRQLERETKRLEAKIRQEEMGEDIKVLRQKVRLLERKLNQIPGQFEPTPPLRSRPWPTQFVHQLATVAAGQSAVVFSYSAIRPGEVALLRYLGVKWFPLTSIIWELDGVEVETITRTIGDPTNSIANPFQFQVPYEIQSNIRFIAYNNDTVSHVFEVYGSGDIVPIELMDHMPVIRVPKLA